MYHTAEVTLSVLRPVFEDCIISLRVDVVCPPRSCDLTPLDYYLWGAVKDKYYAETIILLFSIINRKDCLKFENIFSLKKRYLADPIFIETVHNTRVASYIVGFANPNVAIYQLTIVKLDIFEIICT